MLFQPQHLQPQHRWVAVNLLSAWKVLQPDLLFEHLDVISVVILG